MWIARPKLDKCFLLYREEFVWPNLVCSLLDKLKLKLLKSFKFAPEIMNLVWLAFILFDELKRAKIIKAIQFFKMYS